MSNYGAFLKAKAQLGGDHGFPPAVVHDWLFDFQKFLVEWACRKGRSAIFADCGLGKTAMQLSWADNVVRKTNRPVLILTPIAVGFQTEAEAVRFGVSCRRQPEGGSPARAEVVISNYERLHRFDPSDFAGVVCDESSILKNFDGATKAAVTEFMRTIPYRLLCTATAAPNDYHELGTSSEALGYLGYQDMLTRFFKEEVVKDRLNWGRVKYRFRGHAAEPFWRWVCSWAKSLRRPSDIGFDDGRFLLPDLIESEVIVPSLPRPGMLFPVPGRDLREERQERKQSIASRCEVAASIATERAGPAVVWCHLNEEGDLLERLIPGSAQVKGGMSDPKKEELFVAFARGELRVLVTKPKIGCFGLNWQHCDTVVTFASHSWEQYYQAVRRCWRFGQKNTVRVSVVTSEGEARVLANLRRKSEAAEKMFASLARYMSDALDIDHSRTFSQAEEVPAWLSLSK